MSHPEYDVIVVGAGAVGVSCALWATMRGSNVLLVDGEKPGSGASFGNAGTIATYACVPVNDPSMLTRLPQLLFSRESPLGFSWQYALRHPTWLAQFLRNCSTRRVEAITDHLGSLLSHADAGLNPLIERADASDLLVNNDCLYVYSSRAGFESSAMALEGRRRNGVDFEILNADEVLALEPALKMPIHRGLLFLGARHTIDPQALITRLFDRFVLDGGRWIRQRAVSTHANSDGVTVTLGDGTKLNGARVVIAAGAHSKSIARSGAENLPLETERGHHIEYSAHGELLRRPVGWADAGFYATPMSSGLRCAGTVEIAGLERPKSAGRITYLKRKSREMFGDLGEPDGEWLGHRPTFPDALPALGTSPVSDRIVFAFGHQHIGLTLAGITGRIVADLLEGRSPNIDISAFNPTRFQ